MGRHNSIPEQLMSSPIHRALDIRSSKPETVAYTEKLKSEVFRPPNRTFCDKFEALQRNTDSMERIVIAYTDLDFRMCTTVLHVNCSDFCT